MRGIPRIAVLVALVFVLMAAMTTTVLAKKPSPDPLGGGGADITVQANDAGWVTSGVTVSVATALVALP
jgi:hypothetical protein